MIKLSDSHYGNHIVVPSSPVRSQAPCRLQYIPQAVGGGLGRMEAQRTVTLGWRIILTQ